MRFTRWTIWNPVPINLLTILVFFFGIGSFVLLNRELFPPFLLDIIQVSVEMEGGSTPEQVDRNIVQVIQPNIETVEGVKKITSVATEGSAQIYIDVERGYDVYRVKDDIETEIDAIQSLPEEALEPKIVELKHFIKAIFLAVHDASVSQLELHNTAEFVKNDLRAKDIVSRAEQYNARPLELSVRLPLENLQAHELTVGQVAQAVEQYNFERNAGEVKAPDGHILIKGDARKTTVRELAQVPIHFDNGEFVRLNDLVTPPPRPGIEYGFSEDEAITELNGVPAGVVTIERTDDEDVIDLCRGVIDYANNASLPNGLKMSTFQDFSVLVQERLALISKNAAQGLLLVLLVLSLFLEWRTAFWVAAGIAFSLVGAAAVLLVTGGTINMLTLFGFLIAIGIVVDDAIVIGEDFFDRRRQGLPAFRAAEHAVKHMGKPVLAMMSTTVTAFIPLFFVAGVMGKFIEVFPVVVIGALLLSLTESLLILPVHLAHHGGDHPSTLMRIVRILFWPLVKISEKFQPRITTGLERLTSRYLVPAVRWCVYHRYAVLLITISLFIFIAGLVPAGIVKTALFPQADADFHQVELEYEKGTPIRKVKAGIDTIVVALRETANEVAQIDGVEPIEDYFLDIGSQGSHKAILMLKLISTEKGRSTSGQEFLDRWRRRVSKPAEAVSLTFVSAQAGPPAKPIEIILSSDHDAQLTAADQATQDYLSTLNGVVDIGSNSRRGARTVDVQLKPEYHTLDVTEAEVIGAVADAYSGVKVDTFYRGDNEVKTYIRAALDDRTTLQQLRELQLPSGLRIGQVANLRLYRSPSEIHRTNGRRSSTIYADIDRTSGANAVDLRRDIAKQFLSSMQNDYPDVEWEFSGESQEGNEAVTSMIHAFIPALLVIYAILATIFRSYLQPLIIMFAIPVAMLGAVVGHYVMDIPFNLMSAFGLVALTGVAVNDSLVLLDCVNENVRGGRSIGESLAEAVFRRQRPIFLTSVTTVAGMSGILFEKSFQAQFLIPLVTSLTFGIMFSTLVIYFLIPVLYSILLDVQIRIHHAMGGTKTKEELVIGVVEE